MTITPGLLKWIMRFYPPLFFQRIWVVKIEEDFTGADVKINKSFFNRNYNNSIFGGTIMAAADPFYPVLFNRIFTHKGYKVIAWSKSVQIQFLKPALTNLHFNIKLSDDDITEAEHVLNTGGKYVKAHPIDIYNDKGEVCVSIMSEVYVRNLDFIESLQE